MTVATARVIVHGVYAGVGLGLFVLVVWLAGMQW